MREVYGFYFANTVVFSSNGESEGTYQLLTMKEANLMLTSETPGVVS